MLRVGCVPRPPMVVVRTAAAALPLPLGLRLLFRPPVFSCYVLLSILLWLLSIFLLLLMLLLLRQHGAREHITDNAGD